MSAPGWAHRHPKSPAGKTLSSPATGCELEADGADCALEVDWVLRERGKRNHGRYKERQDIRLFMSSSFRVHLRLQAEASACADGSESGTSIPWNGGLFLTYCHLRETHSSTTLYAGNRHWIRFQRAFYHRPGMNAKPLLRQSKTLASGLP